jgi:hypothetical protein
LERGGEVERGRGGRGGDGEDNADGFSYINGCQPPVGY